jgi:formylglycine-generating enzyme required for sulfatase activity
MNFLVLMFGVLLLANVAHAETPSEQLQQMVEQLQKSPNDNALREKIITLAATLKPAPVIPDEAERRMARGAAAFKGAKSVADYKEAAREFEQATLTAPWYGDAYFNLGFAQDKAENHEAALRSLKLAQLALPGSKDIKALIYEVEYRRDKAQVIKEEEAKGPAMVRIPGRNYEMGKYEVTQKEWREVMGSNPSKFSNCGDTCPVEQVSWNDAQEFIQKLNQKTGKQYRLPTEAEWEYACYGGSQSEYCGGNDVGSVAWYESNSGGTTHPAGQKQANGYGLYDMSGNVWEWMENKYDNEHDWRVLRGGSWNDVPVYTRSAFRNFITPADRYYSFGFRVARTLP